jgi:hypothetical protein
MKMRLDNENLARRAFDCIAAMGRVDSTEELSGTARDIFEDLTLKR